MNIFILSLFLVSLAAARPTEPTLNSEEKRPTMALGEAIDLPTNFPTPEGYNIMRHMLEVDHRDKMEELRQIEAKFTEADERTSNKYWVYWLLLSRFLG